MQSLGGFLGKFNSNITRQIQNLSLIIDTINKHTGILVDLKQISISNGILKIKTSSVEKNEIFIKKTKILKDLEGKLPGQKLNDIR